MGTKFRLANSIHVETLNSEYLLHTLERGQKMLREGPVLLLPLGWPLFKLLPVFPFPHLNPPDPFFTNY